MTFRVLAVEDEPLVAKRALRLSGAILGPQLLDTHTEANVTDAEAWLSENEADLILLDLNLAGEDGFDLLKRFTAKAAHTIVISANTDRALEAFEYGVLDFVPKPFTQERLAKALARFVGEEKPDEACVKHLAFEGRGGVEVVPLSDILFFQAADKYSEATLVNGVRKFHGKSLNRLQDILSSSFMRTHKSYLVQNKAVEGLKSLEGSRYALSLKGGEQLPVGRTRVDHVRQLLACN